MTEIDLDKLESAFEIIEYLDQIGHGENAVIPIWPKDWKLPDGTEMTYKDHPKLTVGAYMTLCGMAKAYLEQSRVTDADKQAALDALDTFERNWPKAEKSGNPFKFSDALCDMLEGLGKGNVRKTIRAALMNPSEWQPIDTYDVDKQTALDYLSRVLAWAEVGIQSAPRGKTVPCLKDAALVIRAALMQPSQGKSFDQDLAEESIGFVREMFRKLDCDKPFIDDACQAVIDKFKPKEGWKFVPVEPTEEMRMAAGKKSGFYKHQVSHADVYKAMIAVAPDDMKKQDKPLPLQREINRIRKSEDR